MCRRASCRAACPVSRCGCPGRVGRSRSSNSRSRPRFVGAGFLSPGGLAGGRGSASGVRGEWRAKGVDQRAMPRQQGVRRHNGLEVRQCPSPERSSLRGEANALIVAERLGPSCSRHTRFSAWRESIQPVALRTVRRDAFTAAPSPSAAEAGRPWQDGTSSARPH